MLAGPSPKCFFYGKRVQIVPTRLVPYVVLVILTCSVLLGRAYSQVSANAASGWVVPSDQRLRQLEDLSEEVNQRDPSENVGDLGPPVICQLQPYPDMSNSISVRSLQIPEKVENEHQKACFALRGQKISDSEKHLRKAVQIDSLDTLAWVMLGKLLQTEEQLDQATDACSQAILHDPSYWPADLCLAEISARKQKWQDSIAESDRAVSVNVASKRFAYFLSSVALLNLDRVHDAESRALEAERLDRDFELAPLRLLLARIDEIKGDRQAAVTQLRDCVQNAKNSLAGNLAKEQLVRLKSESK